MSREHRIFADLPSFHFDPSKGEHDLTPARGVPLDAESSHYLSRVLRLKVGDQVVVIDRQNFFRFLAVLESASNTKAKALLVRYLSQGDAQACVSTLYTALCKGKKTDLVCEKATELGVERIVVYQGQRSVPQVESPKDAQRRILRWRKIAESACLQCNRNSIPDIFFLFSLSELPDFLESYPRGEEALLCCSLAEEALPLRELEPPGGPIHLLIGPEGDISDQEYEILKSLRFQLVSLGPHVLRSETAAIAAISSAQALWGAFR